MNFRFQKSN